MKLYHKKDNKIIVNNLMIADSFFKRFRGLMNTSSLDEESGLLLTPCNGVHTFFMRYPIDVVFLDIDYKVVAITANLKPNRLSPVFKAAHHVLELPATKADSLEITAGDIFLIKNR